MGLMVEFGKIARFPSIVGAFALNASLLGCAGTDATTAPITAAAVSSSQSSSRFWSQPNTDVVWDVLSADLVAVKFEDAAAKCSELNQGMPWVQWRVPTLVEAKSAANAGIATSFNATSQWKGKLFWTSDASGNLSDYYYTVDLTNASTELRRSSYEASAYVICLSGDMPISAPVTTGTGQSQTDTASVTPPKNTVNSSQQSAQDAAAPTLVIVDKPATRTTNRSPAFRVTSDEKLKEVSCSIDLINLPCSYDYLYTVEGATSYLSDGMHNLAVRAKDLSGNSASVYYSFSVDTTPPTLSFWPSTVSAMNNTISGSDARKCYYVTVSKETASVLYSKLDSLAWVLQESGNSFNVCVLVGQHTFQVKAQDDLGNESAPISTTWTLLGKYYGQTISGVYVIRDRTGPYWFTTIYAAAYWNDAYNGCNALSVGGYSDWTLPSSQIAMTWNVGGVKNFVSNTNATFWTSTYFDMGRDTWYHTNNFATASNSGESAWPTTQTAYVRCMRIGN